MENQTMSPQMSLRKRDWGYGLFLENMVKKLEIP
jgi:hypothetical protein